MFYTPKPTVKVQVTDTGESFSCAKDENLLRGMLRLGKRGIPVGCVNGGCGVCKVQIVQGEVLRLGPVSRAHVTVDEEAQGCTLACRVAPQTDVVLSVVGRMAKPFRAGAAARGAGSPSPQPTL
ncbi:MAG: 2Fe-2S iron-sulfur cluster-binding protein [Tepidimonas ignava]|uniref:2Fe-2S iron-sulfur cluster-binding protein n=1 Tax=Tepidimonas ignava TaxID=114249 RepID=UPI00391B62AF